MDNIEKSLNKIAETILYLDEASLTSLWNKYREKVEKFSASADWQRAVIILSIINAVRAKNAIINENLLKNPSQKPVQPSETPKAKPYLKLVK